MKIPKHIIPSHLLQSLINTADTHVQPTLKLIQDVQASVVPYVDPQEEKDEPES